MSVRDTVQTQFVIRTSSGDIKPVGPGIFVAQHVSRVIERPMQTLFDDPIQITLIEMGSMLDEDSLKFRQKRLQYKEIFDLELLPDNYENRTFREAAIEHFGIQEMNRFVKSRKNTIPVINGDLTINDIDTLALEFMREGGTDGILVWMKGCVIIVDQMDFSIHLMDVYKAHKNSKMRCGALFCKRPFRVVKASFTGNVRLT